MFGDTVAGAGTTPKGDINYQNVIFSIDPSYACGIFQSCEKVSFIAQSGITSSLAFLDFLGVNGQDQSLSIITFDLLDDPAAALQGEAYPCEMEVEEDGILGGYAGITNSTCSYCDAACQPPDVNDDIAFLDGLNWKLVGYSYLGFILFTIAFQVLSHFCCRRKALEVSESGISGHNSYTSRPSTGALNKTGEDSYRASDYSAR